MTGNHLVISYSMSAAWFLRTMDDMEISVPLLTVMLDFNIYRRYNSMI